MCIRDRVRNPHDPTYYTGGSSSGSAAAVGAKMLLAALGTDTGGSIRIPSSICGVVGMKPTYSLISIEGVMPLSESLDTIDVYKRQVHNRIEMCKMRETALSENDALHKLLQRRDGRCSA